MSSNLTRKYKPHEKINGGKLKNSRYIENSFYDKKNIQNIESLNIYNPSLDYNNIKSELEQEYNKELNKEQQITGGQNLTYDMIINELTKIENCILEAKKKK